MTEMTTAAEAEQNAMATCTHQDAVKWNPYNGVVQCHRCGHIFLPAPVDSDTGLYTQAAQAEIEQSLTGDARYFARYFG